MPDDGPPGLHVRIKCQSPGCPYQDTPDRLERIGLAHFCHQCAPGVRRGYEAGKREGMLSLPGQVLLAIYVAWILARAATGAIARRLKRILGRLLGRFRRERTHDSCGRAKRRRNGDDDRAAA
jgi:hypothetical protein